MLLTSKLLLVLEDGTLKTVSSAKEAFDCAKGKKAIAYSLQVAMTIGHNKAEQAEPQAVEEVKAEDVSALARKTAKRKK